MTGPKKIIKDRSSLFLSVGAGVGVLATAYLTGRASFQAANRLSEEAPDMELKEQIQIVWKLYIPAGVAGATTILLIGGVKHVDARKTLAAQTALAVSQGAYESYRAQVVEELGEKKDQTFLAKVAEKQIEGRPPSALVVGDGSVMCCELYTGRYFMSDMQTLRTAVNDINARMLRHDYATLDDFYYEVGLENTATSGQTGWDSTKFLDLEFSSVLYREKPCLAFGYNYVKSF